LAAAPNAPVDSSAGHNRGNAIDLDKDDDDRGAYNNGNKGHNDDEDSDEKELEKADIPSADIILLLTVLTVSHH
jgi:hypothetical protein